MSLSMTRSLPDPRYDPAFYDGVLPKRAIAWVIDVALILVAMVVLSLVSAGIFFVLWIPVHFVVSFLYRWLTIRARSATFGMRLMNIELRDRTGAPLTEKQAALHTISYLICAVFILLHLVSLGLMIARPFNRGIPDEIVGSAMINRPV